MRLIFSLLWYRRKMTISQERVQIWHVGIKAKIFSWKFCLYLHRTRNFKFQSIHELWAILWDLVYKLLNAWDFEVPCLMPRKGDIPGEKLCFYDLVKNLYSFLRYGQFHECTREGKRPIAASSSVLEKSMVSSKRNCLENEAESWKFQIITCEYLIIMIKFWIHGFLNLLDPSSGIFNLCRQGLLFNMYVIALFPWKIDFPMP